MGGPSQYSGIVSSLQERGPVGPCALGLMCSFEAVFMLGPAWASAPQGTAEPCT